MSIKELTDHLIDTAPVATLISGLSTYLLSDELLNEIFDDNRQRSYQNKIKFSDMVTLLIPVVFGSQASVRSSYNSQNPLKEVASLKSFYEKLNRLDIAIPQGLLAESSARCEKILQVLQPNLPDLLAEFRVRMIDGNHFEASERRLDGMQAIYAPLPAMSLIIRDYKTGLIQQTIYDLDNWASELALVPEIEASILSNDCMIGDSLYSGLPFLLMVERRRAFYVTRHKKGTTIEEQEPIKGPIFVGESETALVYESNIFLTKQRHPCRCVLLKLKQPTREGENEIRLLTNLPIWVSALLVADLYLKRRSIESCFQDLTTALNCEIDTLAYPKASVLVFSLACCLLNVLQVVKHSLAQAQQQTQSQQNQQAQQPEPKPEAAPQKLIDLNLSAYSLIQEVVFASALIAYFKKVSDDYPKVDWSIERVVDWLKRWSELVNLKKYQKAKPQPNRKKKETIKKSGTYSTQRMLDERKQRRKTP